MSKVDAHRDRSLTQLIEALGSFSDLSAASLQLPLQPFAQVQDANNPPQQVTRHLPARIRQDVSFLCSSNNTETYGPMTASTSKYQ